MTDGLGAALATMSADEKLELARRLLGEATDITANIDISHAPWWKKIPIAFFRLGRTLQLWQISAVGYAANHPIIPDGKLH